MAAGDAFRPDIPSTARMYDYYLGGKDNYPADREAAEQVIAMMPDGIIRGAARQNRAFLGRAVRYLATELGIRQFLDIGTGLPTMSSVHEVAQAVDPRCRVVYVDHDPVVLAHARDLLHGAENTTILSRDLRQPEQILGDPELTAMFDPGQPVAVLLVAVLHFIADAEDPAGIIGQLMDALPTGSCLVVSHATADSFAELDDAIEVYRNATSRMFNRSRAEVGSLFAGLDLVEPGIVWLPQWRPDSGTERLAEPGRSLCWCGVGRKTRPGPSGSPARTEPAAGQRSDLSSHLSLVTGIHPASRSSSRAGSSSVITRSLWTWRTNPCRVAVSSSAASGAK